VTRLRYALPEVGTPGQPVPFDNGDLRELAGERLGDQQAGHTATYHGDAAMGHA
jgi:hypothetical protein